MLYTLYLCPSGMHLNVNLWHKRSTSTTISFHAVVHFIPRPLESLYTPLPRACQPLDGYWRQCDRKSITGATKWMPPSFKTWCKKQEFIVLGHLKLAWVFLSLLRFSVRLSLAEDDEAQKCSGTVHAVQCQEQVW